MFLCFAVYLSSFLPLSLCTSLSSFLFVHLSFRPSASTSCSLSPAVSVFLPRLGVSLARQTPDSREPFLSRLRPPPAARRFLPCSLFRPFSSLSRSTVRFSNGNLASLLSRSLRPLLSRRCRLVSASSGPTNYRTSSRSRLFRLSNLWSMLVDFFPTRSFISLAVSLRPELPKWLVLLGEDCCAG